MRYLEEVAKIGDYVEYFPSVTQFTVKYEMSGYPEEQQYDPSKTTLWRVFRNITGGVEIASSSSAGLFSVAGETGYASIVDIMTEFSNAFVNSRYALRGRAMGSTQSSIGRIQVPQDWRAHFNGYARYPYYDEEYTNDVNQIYANGLMTEKWLNMFLASRDMLIEKDKVQFGIRKLCPTLTAFAYARLIFSEDMIDDEMGEELVAGIIATGNIVPVVGLLPDVLVVDGDGSLEKPFRIDI